jgi:hypothetical protein
MALPKTLVKVALVLAVLAGLAYMFVRSVREARAVPYTVAAAHLGAWTIALEPAPQANGPMLVLRAPEKLGSDLFQQVFARAMESMKGSTAVGVPVVLQSEFEMSLAANMTPDALLAAAVAAGLERAEFTPRCLAVRRVSEPGQTRQVYFVIFDAPDFGRFRERLALQSHAAAASMGTFDAAALSPVLVIGGTDGNLNRWLPIRANPDVDCVAPITID